MSNDPNCIEYKFGLGEQELTFAIDTNAPPSPLISPADEKTYPEWTRLENNQCAHCPLNTADCSRCPAAVRVHEVLEAFKDSTSFERVDLTVTTQRRTFHQECDLQSGLNSMLGLQMATSGCPILEKLRSMTNFHIPSCSVVETLYRTVGAYLTQQFFAYKEGGVPDWDLEGLKTFYGDLEILNEAFCERIRAIAENDAAANAIVLFFAASVVVADSIGEDLTEYKDYFTGRAPLPPKDI